jgi:hypothetical protein
MRLIMRPGARDGLRHRDAGTKLLRPAALALAVGLAVLRLDASAFAQYPPANIPSIQERSGLMMRFAGLPGSLPPDPLRDNFYGSRYADTGLVKHQNNWKTQGLYGLGWKARCTESVYPFFYGSPGNGKVGEECRPWHRSFRFAQGLAHPFRPVGMYYQMGSYVPIYDLDPIAPGPGPYPFPFYFNWHKGG